METLFSKTFDVRINHLNTLIGIARFMMDKDPDASKEILNRTAGLLICDATQINTLYDEISKFIIEDMSDVISPAIDTLRIHTDPKFLEHFCTQLREFCECYIDLMRIHKCYIRSLDLKLKDCLVYLGSPDITAGDLLTHVLAIWKCSYHAKNFT